jgi:hypothetical protein
MNLNGMKLITDSEFRDQFIHDNNFWLIMVGISYLFIIGIATTFVIRHFTVFLWIAISLSVISNVLGLIILKNGSAIGALNSPLISLLTFRLLYEWYKKMNNKPPLHMLDVAYSNTDGIFYDRLLYVTWYLISGASTAGFALMYGEIL